VSAPHSKTDHETTSCSLALSTLKKRAEFLACAASGRKCATKGIVVQYRPHADDTITAPLRFGITASKRVGNAVCRNRAKRRLRAIAAAVLPHMAQPHADYVLIAKPDTITRDFALLRGDLVYALKKLEALKKTAAQKKSTPRPASLITP
jgi:ribonuclease P protein component